MKRFHHLIEQIADLGNLELAFWKAQRGKSAKREVQSYRQHLYKNLTGLSHQIQTGKVLTGDYRRFRIYDPKEREICAASFPERVLHHALMNICHPIFERYQIYDSYATRIGKGVYAAIERAGKYQAKYRWFLKLDVRKHFENIDHGLLNALLARQFKEEKLLQIFARIIDDYYTRPKVGLPIGNLTSQYFANHFLAVGDHYIKEQCSVKAYVRYMDDMVLLGNDRSSLLDTEYRFASFLSETLKLALKPFCLNTVQRGLPFLGDVLTDSSVRLNQRSRKRFDMKLKQYEYDRQQGIWTESAYQRHFLPLLAFTQKADSCHFRKHCLASIDFLGAN